jgi:hypothetical protein
MDFTRKISNINLEAFRKSIIKLLLNIGKRLFDISPHENHQLSPLPGEAEIESFFRL